ncbi:hypothetical protein ACJRO7_031692 [Eucalyptus globulus]|uniref:EF-hand domain-containing protein n=1 Tax=Eucalyptus globulus TaxID=34317 RepID=A0ABD3JH87_EUCGL
MDESLEEEERKRGRGMDESLVEEREEKEEASEEEREEKEEALEEEREEKEEASVALPTEPSKPVSAKIDIKKVREAASAHFKDLTEDQKKAARSLFDTMDKDENGNISFDEFKTFLSDAGLQTVDPDGLFAELDKDASETLSFEELVTFFYVLSRDENKDRWKRKPVHGQEARIAPGMTREANDKARIAPGMAREANDKGRKRDKILPWVFDKLKGTYKLEELREKASEKASENSCTIF